MRTGWVLLSDKDRNVENLIGMAQSLINYRDKDNLSVMTYFGNFQHLVRCDHQLIESIDYIALP